ncbi:MAG: type II toxin-antitoxin system VapC family toxin [Acidobacteriota bacterium]
MLLDSNIVIYAAKPEHGVLREFIAERGPAVSVVNYIEVLGYHRLREVERGLLEEFFRAAEVLPLTEAIVERAVQLRQQRSISLGDAILAATALVHSLTLVTHNTDDFNWIAKLRLHGPLGEGA